jgi:FlaA1/EpsC-like NDP-sugar epimerase
VSLLFYIFINLRNRHIFVLDVIAWCVAAPLALALRLDGFAEHHKYISALIVYIALAIPLRALVFRAFGLYARYWRYASVDELLLITVAVGTATVPLALLFSGLVPFINVFNNDLPRSIPLIDGGLVFTAASGVRFSVRLAERFRHQQLNHQAQRTRVVIFGAGDAGTMLVREMQQNPALGLVPVAFLDADRAKHGTWILGVPVVGDRTKLHEVVEKYKVQQAIIAMPSAPGKTIRELARLCREINLPVKTAPGVFELRDGSVTVGQLRSIDITDLLRREPVQIEMDAIAALLRGKRVLVTGAGGSIGSELCRQIARCAPAQLFLLGHGENTIFDIHNELKRFQVSSSKLEVGSDYQTPNSEPRTSNFELQSPISNLQSPASNLHPLIADIRDCARLRAIFQRHRPQIVFHAAAHKHVPLMEANIEDAITNNVLGTRNLIECAIETDVEHFVLISTDKAVNPTSVMGATKRVAEMLVQDAAARTGKNFVAVRFGNVLDSRGSVVPLFRKQIAAGGPVTITHPDVRRFFMTIPEAVQLVLQTLVFAEPGAIFVLDMGEPIKIVDLAHDLIRLSGYEPDEIPIEFIGLRPGEKLYEELFVPEENYCRTAHPKIFIAQNGNVPISNPQSPISNLPIDALIAVAQRGDADTARRLLREIVPEYQGGAAMGM